MKRVGEERRVRGGEESEWLGGEREWGRKGE